MTMARWNLGIQATATAIAGVGLMRSTLMATTKPTIGRPRRTAKLADNRITVRLTDDELSDIDAARGNLPRSDWMRDAVLEAARR
jgi:hypothetical protein